MDPGTLIFVVFVAGLGAAGYRTGSMSQIVGAWRTSAILLQLDVARVGLREVRLSGYIDGFELSATTRSDAFGRRWVTHIELDLGGRVPRDITLASEQGWRRLTTIVAGEDQQIGDAAFDDAVRIAGDPVRCAALLDAEARAALGEAIRRHQVTLQDGRLVVHRGRMRRSRDLIATIRAMAAAAATLKLEADDPLGRLARNATADPVAQVRANNLRLLVQRYRSAPQTQAALQAALTDEAAGNRAFAASFLGVEGQVGHVSVVEDVRADAALRVAALETVETSLPPDELGRLVRLALESPHQTLRQAAAGVVERRCLDGLEDALRAALVGATSDTAVALCRAMAAHGPDARNESVLVALLDDRAASTRRAAVDALGEIGHLPAIAALQRSLETGRADAALREAVHDAVGRIQQRHGVGAGRLSLVEAPGATGGLSLADAGEDEVE